MGLVGVVLVRFQEFVNLICFGDYDGVFEVDFFVFPAGCSGSVGSSSGSGPGFCGAGGALFHDSGFWGAEDVREFAFEGFREGDVVAALLRSKDLVVCLLFFFGLGGWEVGVGFGFGRVEVDAGAAGRRGEGEADEGFVVVEIAGRGSEAVVWVQAEDLAVVRLEVGAGGVGEGV